MVSEVIIKISLFHAKNLLVWNGSVMRQPSAHYAISLSEICTISLKGNSVS